MEPNASAFLRALETLLHSLRHGHFDLPAAQRELAHLRVALLRSHRRSIALLLSAGVVTLPHMERAVVGAIGALVARDPRLRKAA